MIFKYLFLILETILVIWTLRQINKKKKYLQMFPDGFKDQYYKASRTMTLICTISVVLVLTSYTLIKTNYFFILSILSMFLSSHAILSIYEDFQDLEHDSNE